MTIEKKRAEKGRKEIDRKKKTEENQRMFSETIQEDFSSFVVRKAKESGKTPEEVRDELFSKQFAIIEFNETTGKASLVYNAWQGVAIGEKIKVDEKTLTDFRDLRENFAPVAAGVEWHRDFTSGGGFLVQIDDPTDLDQIEKQEEIIRLCRNVYQDQYIKGLDTILDIKMDIALTDGCAAAEIVYEKDVVFDDYVDEIEEVVNPVDGKKIKVIVPKEMTGEEWQKLKGISRLKIIEDAYNRLIPYRHPISGEVLYWTLDEKPKTSNMGLSYDEIVSREREKKKAIIKFHPWEILWLSWNQRGTNLKGMSIIQPVYSIAKMVQSIQTAVGKGFNRWANKKYFFICGTERRPWNKKHLEEFLKSMEKMIANNWIGLPVPAGFEIREIGGEQSVFEGKNLLDHLIGMIAAGMQYPREFLEVGRSMAGDKAWLAWTVRYGRSQLQIRRAIEHQLWERHLWCRFGVTYKERKKGVPQERQKDIPIYVPKMQWRAEGQWHRDTKIKMLSGLLNVANPVDVPLKMSIQKQMGETLGMGEIDWSKVNELLEIEADMRITRAKIEKMRLDQKFKKLEEIVKAGQEIPEETEQQPKERGVQPPQTLRQTEKRLEGGVSKTPTATGTQTKKGQAKQMGGTRLAETSEVVTEFEVPIPKDEYEKRRDELVQSKIGKTKAEQKKIEWEIELLDHTAKQMKKIDNEIDRMVEKEGDKK